MALRPRAAGPAARSGRPPPRPRSPPWPRRSAPGGRLSTDGRGPLLAGPGGWQAAAAQLRRAFEGVAVPSSDHGLLARLDALVELVADRHGLALVPGGPPGGVSGGLPGARLAAAQARRAARAIGLARPSGPGSRSPAVTQRDAVELLRAVAEGVGLLRVRGDRLVAARPPHPWAPI